MANINIEELAKSLNDKPQRNVADLSDYTHNLNTMYKDVVFDLDSKSSIFSNNAINSQTSYYDIDVALNESAVINSVSNWLQTTKYSRLLNPELHFDLRSYLFEKLDQYTAYFIGLEIMEKLPFYEPRVSINNCTVELDYIYDRYIITLDITIPSLNNKQLNIKEILNRLNY